MAEIRTVTTLQSKRDEIAAAIANYEHKLAQARADLAHISAAIAIFEASGDKQTMSCYVDVHRLFKYGEAIKLCKEAIEFGPKSTRELALYIIAAKGLDTQDKVLAHSIAGRIIHALRQQCFRGLIDGTDRIKGVRIWRLPDGTAEEGKP